MIETHDGLEFFRHAHGRGSQDSSPVFLSPQKTILTRFHSLVKSAINSTCSSSSTTVAASSSLPVRFRS